MFQYSAMHVTSLILGFNQFHSKKKYGWKKKNYFKIMRDNKIIIYSYIINKKKKKISLKISRVKIFTIYLDFFK